MLFVPLGVRLLECGNALSLRGHLAGLAMFAKSFGDETGDSPPLAAGDEAFRARALTSTVRHAASSDLRPGTRWERKRAKVGLEDCWGIGRTRAIITDNEMAGNLPRMWVAR